MHQTLFFTHQLVGVPVECSFLKDKPVLLPFDSQETLGLLLPVQPALVVRLTELFDGDSSSTHGTIACTQIRLVCESTETLLQANEALAEASR